MDANTLDILLRLGVAIILGAVVGLERTLAGKTAGMRTYAMVALGSSLFVLIGQIVADTYSTIGLDPLRMASQIIVGVGFIGAGLVILQGNKITGITSAAGLWVSAGVGMACGFALYKVAVIVVVLTIIVFTIMWFLEKKMRALSYDNLQDEEEKR